MNTRNSNFVVPVAPEDIMVGGSVVVMHETDQFAVRSCVEDLSGRPKLEVVRVRTMASFPGVLRVLAVALPFVLVEDSEGNERLVDVRLKELGRVPPTMGRRAMRTLDRTRRADRAANRKPGRKGRPRGTDAPRDEGGIAEGAD